jgi:hypothetical protein
MNETDSTAFADPELSELFDREPELLAIADAIVATRPKPRDGQVTSALHRRRVSRRARVLLAAAVLAAVVAVVPALAFSTTARELVGLTAKSASPHFVARVTDVIVHGARPRPGTLITVTFTVGEQSKPPGTGIPPHSSFLVFVGGLPGHLAAAHGRSGGYSATIRLARSEIGAIQIGGFMPGTGPKVLNGGFWIPTIVDIPE